MKKGKKYLEALNKVDKSKLYTLDEAVKLVKETSVSKFDSSVEIAVRLNLDTRKSDQQLRGAIVLPSGTGKEKKVLVIAKGDNAKLAREAGADFVGDTDMLEKIEKENWLDFDVMIATPDMMPLLGKLGKVLGPKGLMPNPKLGTVTTNVKDAITNIKKGMVEYKNDSYGNVHMSIGKLSFSEEKLEENLRAIVNEIVKNKPTAVKGTFVKNISVSTTMGPGVKVDKASLGL